MERLIGLQIVDRQGYRLRLTPTGRDLALAASRGTDERRPQVPRGKCVGVGTALRGSHRPVHLSGQPAGTQARTNLEISRRACISGHVWRNVLEALPGPACG